MTSIKNIIFKLNVSRGLMNISTAELTKKVLSLSTEERIIIAQQIWESVEDFVTPDVEKEWLEESEKRWRDIEEGRVKCIPAEEVIQKVKASLKK